MQIVISTIRTSEGLTDWFDITSGVRQGCVLSPLLFITYMDSITKEANLESEALNELLFADDRSLAHESEERLQEHTSSLNSICEEYDMKISINKTETMKVRRTPGTLNININNTNLKQVKEFKYLGSIFTEDGRMNREIENRIQKANNVSYQLAPLLKHPDIPMETKSKIINFISLRPNTHIPIPNLDHDQASGAQNYNLRNGMLKESCQQDQKRPDSQHQNQRNGRNKEHPPSYATSEDQMV